MKVLPPAVARDSEAMPRFEREALTVSALNHPNILVIHEIGGAGELRYLVTEFIEGESLRVEFHQQALELQRAAGKLRREALSLANLGHVHNLLGRHDAAAEHFDKALNIFRAIEDRNSAARTLEGLARAERGRGRLAEARRRVEESLALVEEVRARPNSQQFRASYFATKQGAYELYIDLLMRLHRERPEAGFDAEALGASERARARSITELLTEAGVDIRRGVDAELVGRERELVQSLGAKAQRQIQLLAQKGGAEQAAALGREIGELEREYALVQAAIREKSPAYLTLTRPAPLNAREIQQQLLDADTLLLEYSLGDERSHLWAVTRDSLKGFGLARRAEIEAAARALY